MAYEHREFPEFSWSMSRQKLLEQCPRAYFYRYYLGHNGWLDDAPAESREAYRLGKLTGFDALLGQEIDVRARELEACAREGSPPPSIDDMERRTRDALNAVWKSSKQNRQAFESRPSKVTMLRAMYLGQNASSEVARVNERLRVCLENLATREHWSLMAESGSEGKVDIPDFASFVIDQTKVFAIPDLVYIHDKTLHVIDWKSGRREDRYETQVLLSTFWAWDSVSRPADMKVAGHLEYLLDGASVPVPLPDDLEAAVRDVVSDGVGEMRRLLRDPQVNAPVDIGAFERRRSGLCATCNFKQPCERDD